MTVTRAPGPLLYDGNIDRDVSDGRSTRSSAVKRRTTFSRMRDTSLSKPLTGNAPQSVIDPTENTTPPGQGLRLSTWERYGGRGMVGAAGIEPATPAG